MRKYISLITVFVTLIVSFFAASVFLYSQETIGSEYNGKIVKEIHFAGVITKDGKIIGKNGKPISDDNVEKKIVELENISELELVNLCLTEIGKPFDENKIAEDIKGIVSAANLKFCFVEVSEVDGGVAVEFFIEELPRISKIEWRGLVDTRAVDLESKITIKEGDPYLEGQVKRSRDLLIAEFERKGMFDVAVFYRVEDIKNSNTKKVVFTIDEGERKKIGHISLLGTHNINDYELLSLMELKEKDILDTGDYVESTLAMDKQRIIYYYRSKGYMDVRIVSTNVEYFWENPEKKEIRQIYIILKIEEGERYFFDGYSIEGNKKLAKDRLEGVLEQQILFDSPTRKAKTFVDRMIGKDVPNEMVFDGLLFEQDRGRLAMQYSGKGYIRAQIIPEKKIEAREVLVDGVKEKRKYLSVNFKITEGEQAFVENVIIIGNKKTKEKVIRREVLIKEGDLFNSFKLELTRQKINNLGYFKQVNIDIRPGSAEDKANIIIEVEEQPTGTVSLGGGYGTTVGFSIFADLGEKNLFGSGQSIGTKIEYGPTKSSISVNFLEPWLFDYPVSFSTSVYYSLSSYKTVSMFPQSDEYSTYDKEVIGYSVGFGYRFAYYYGMRLSWYHSFLRTKNASGSSPDEIFLSQELGFQEKRTVSYSIYRNSKDNLLNPTSGSYVGLTSSMTGGILLKGKEHYIKFVPEAELFYSPFSLPLLRDYPVVLQFRISGDFLVPPFAREKLKEYQDPEENPWIESDDRMNVGGPGTLRGWAYYDEDFPESWRLGMFHRILYGAELRVPIHKNYLWTALFFDAGSLWTDGYWDDTLSDQDILDNDKKDNLVLDIRDIKEAHLMEYFRYSYGFGVRIQIPMLPLRFWFGRKMIWENGEGFKRISGYNFDFQIGDMRF